MKAESTISRQKKALYRIAQDDSNSTSTQTTAYAMANALQWVTEDTSWNCLTVLRENERRAKP